MYLFYYTIAIFVELCQHIDSTSNDINIHIASVNNIQHHQHSQQSQLVNIGQNEFIIDGISVHVDGIYVLYIFK